MLMGPTSDHAEIRGWAIKYHAIPAEVRPFVFDSMSAVLRFLFEETGELGTPELRPISWESFFARFELQHLVMVYDDQQPTFTILQDEAHRYHLGPGER